MKLLTTDIEGMLIIEPKLLGDSRGFFLESYNERDFDAAMGFAVRFVQDNHSRSKRGVMRGLHYQIPPYEQGKLVRVVSGCVFDVAVDLRQSSRSFGRWVGVTLREDGMRMVWHPPGLAHGFMVTSECADLVYKTTRYHEPDAERCLLWNDPAIGIAWPDLKLSPRMTARDANAPLLADAELFE